jgi:hypothetical protein
MALQKSDAMLQHEKTIEYVILHNPKWFPGREETKVHLLPETHNLVMAFAAIVVIVAAAMSM